MIIDCISDLHGYYPKLEGGDLLIVAGDLTARHIDKEWHEFGNWLSFQAYKKIVFIAGNHDTMIQEWDLQQEKEGYDGPISDSNDRIEYLCDSGTEYVISWPQLEAPSADESRNIYKRNVLKIWGSPWTKRFKGMNPNCMAFTVDTEEELADKWELIPDDIDILVTHSPPLSYFDRASNDECVGSYTLCAKVAKIGPKLHVFGHIHEWGGNILYASSKIRFLPDYLDTAKTTFVNASHVNERYEPVNKPLRVIL